MCVVGDQVSCSISVLFVVDLRGHFQDRSIQPTTNPPPHTHTHTVNIHLHVCANTQCTPAVHTPYPVVTPPAFTHLMTLLGIAEECLGRGLKKG